MWYITSLRQRCLEGGHISYDGIGQVHEHSTAARGQSAVTGRHQPAARLSRSAGPDLRGQRRTDHPEADAIHLASLAAKGTLPSVVSGPPTFFTTVNVFPLMKAR